MAPPQLQLWTIGHSNRDVDELSKLLVSHAVEMVVDVRQFPMSRRNPQFNRDTLPAYLDAVGVEYRHEAVLGGRRKPQPESSNTGWRNPQFRGYADHMQTAAFSAALDHIEALAADRRLALLCAEAMPWRCHRNLIADALTARGHAVRHILTVDRADPHRLTPFARVVGRQVSYPGLPTDGTIDG